MNSVRGASIEHVKQNAIASAHADRLAVSKRFVIDRGGLIQHLYRVVRRPPFSYVLHGDEFRIPLMRREKNFLVIIAGIVFRFDVEEAKLSGIQATAQVFAGEGVGVIPAGSAWLRCERILARTSRWY